eukprot:Nitzschia sp. Nitz4//scaffold374_size14026//8812//11579//NITZ4_008960-RA/size14026-augustus-gene-0.12-mRNA-1//-1//CDS//3329549626//8418//frame0
MVNYGNAIVRSQRVGWENAYLAYNDLKSIVERIERRLIERRDSVVGDSPVDPTSSSSLVDFRASGDLNEAGDLETSEAIAGQNTDELKRQFFAALQLEIEKISLFTLKIQGELADSVGSLRFQETNLYNAISSKPGDHPLKVYSSVAVEMVHLLRYIILNSIGIQKILKKYNKIFERLDEPHHYFMGGDHLHQLANCQSIMAIQSSLQTALGESYTQIQLSNPEEVLPLMRFQVIMECSYILRKYAGLLQAPFMEFLSRQAMIVTATKFGGMDRGSQKALSWLLRLHPEYILSMDQVELELTRSRWFGSTPPSSPRGQHGNAVHMDTLKTIQEEDSTEELPTEAAPQPTLSSKQLWGGVTSPSFFLNLMSIMLYTVNYYIVAPTANRYAIKLGVDGAFGATLIGASSFSALFSAFAYSYWYTKSTFRSALIFSAICPFFGNLMYALAISYNSIPMTIAGRILCGFGQAEVLNRQLISACVSFESMSKASALFVAFGASGMSIGPLIAGILDVTAGRDVDVDLELPFTPAGGIIYDDATAPGFIMAALWLMQCIGLVLFFQEPTRINATTSSFGTDGPDSLEAPEDDDNLFLKPDADTTYGSVHSNDTDTPSSPPSEKTPPGNWVWEEAVSTWRLVFTSAGLPVTMIIFCFIELTDEVIISSCSMVVRRYFGWHGSIAGFFLASLGSLVIPAHFVVEKASRHVSERKILSRSLIAIVCCLVVIFNYSGLIYDIVGVVETDEAMDKSAIKHSVIQGTKLKKLLTPEDEIYYDWGVGKYIYVVFLSLLFMSTIVLEGVDTSIMAKVTPPKLNDKFFNSGLLATLIGTLGRVGADGMITVCALLDIHIFIDFVNATFFPVLILTFGCMYLVDRYYKDLV